MSNAEELIERFRSSVAEGASQDAIKTVFGRLRAIEIKKDMPDGSRRYDTDLDRESTAAMMVITEHAVLCLDEIAKLARAVNDALVDFALADMLKSIVAEREASRGG